MSSMEDVGELKQSGDLTGDGGVIKEILQPGRGTERPEKGDEIIMHYVGKLQDGSIVDSSRTRGQAFKFKLGKGSVIRGWDLVTRTLAKGEKALVTLGPEYAYGQTGSPPRIPPNATLTFEMELENWISAKDLFGDGAVMKAGETEGGGWERPGMFSEVTCKIVAKRLEPSPEKVLFDGEKVFSVGTGTAHKAWDKIVQDMKKDGSVSLICTSPYVSGPGVDFVPADVTKVQYDITLLHWLKVEDVSGDRGVMKKILREGDGWETPNEGAFVSVNIEYRVVTEGVAGDVVIKHEPFIFTVIDGAVAEGIDVAVQKMKLNELAIVYLKAPYAFGSCPNMCPPRIKATDDLEVKIELLSFDRSKDSWSLSVDEKKKQIIARKAKGNQLFKVGRLKLAMRHYEIGTSLFEYRTAELSPEVAREVNELTMACHLNLAACYKKQNDMEKVLVHTKKAIDIEPTNVKALYRRGCAYLELDNFFKAERDFKRALEIQPENSEVKRKLAELSRIIAKQDEADRRRYSNMFAKAK
mmetsp:Transcript_21300/g.30944  ORF Transcript_21300/g.30944 Transcript_21300/m.30944 type:complete len:526 (-) Transcript_21300:439-2016(-)